MHLIHILLPLNDNEGKPYGRGMHRAVADELAEKFGGVTAHARAPAEGLWKEGSSGESEDDVVIYEVMAEKLEKKWWREYREGLETRFRQEEVVVRAQKIERL